jgi:hypothetical protein
MCDGCKKYIQNFNWKVSDYETISHTKMWSGDGVKWIMEIDAVRVCPVASFCECYNEFSVFCKSREVFFLSTV